MRCASSVPGGKKTPPSPPSGPPKPAHAAHCLQRPYVASSQVYYMPPEMEAEARRRAQREAADLNRHMQQVRLVQEEQHRKAEQAAQRSTMQAEVRWPVGSHLSGGGV